jgi:putative ABC transport system permease protein
MSALKQIAAVTALNVRSIPQRLGSSCVVIIGIAGVVGVLVGVLGMVRGLSDTMLATGEPDRAIVLRGGATSDIASSLGLDAVVTIMDAPGVARTPDGDALASADMVTAVNLLRKEDGTRAGIMVRGVGPRAFELRPEIRLTEGRMFEPGLREVIVGRGVQRQFQGVEIDDRITLRDGQWSVVGIFESGDAFESAMLTDADTLLSAYQRTLVNAVTVRLESRDAFESFSDALTTSPTLSVSVQREPDYYSEQTEEVQGLLGWVTTFVVGIMAVGALFAALNTMYSAVSARVVEIATLRAIGFGPVGVVVSVLAEALLLAVLGAALGAAVVGLLYHGNTISLGGTTNSVVFELELTAAVLGTGMLLACGLGFLGGLLPAIRAVRMPVATALRAA